MGSFKEARTLALRTASSPNGKSGQNARTRRTQSSCLSPFPLQLCILASQDQSMRIRTIAQNPQEGGKQCRGGLKDGVVANSFTAWLPSRTASGDEALRWAKGHELSCRRLARVDQLQRPVRHRSSHAHAMLGRSWEQLGSFSLGSSTLCVSGEAFAASLQHFATVHLRPSVASPPQDTSTWRPAVGARPVSWISWRPPPAMLGTAPVAACLSTCWRLGA